MAFSFADCSAICRWSRATSDAQAELGRLKGSRDHRVGCGVPDERLVPWRRPASTATSVGLVPIAKSEVAGPLGISLRLFPACPPNPVATNTGMANLFPRCRRLKKFTWCDLLHISPAPPRLKLRHGQENLPILARIAVRPRDRLRLDRDRRGFRPDRADLSPPDVIQPRDRGRNGPRPRGKCPRAG